MSGKRLVDPVPNMDRLDPVLARKPTRSGRKRADSRQGMAAVRVRWYLSALGKLPVLVAVLVINCIKI
eukprot:SAG11_NODE_19789_length_458_cov_5.874652_1_plen_67_part_10